MFKLIKKGSGLGGMHNLVEKSSKKGCGCSLGHNLSLRSIVWISACQILGYTPKRNARFTLYLCCCILNKTFCADFGHSNIYCRKWQQSLIFPRFFDVLSCCINVHVRHPVTEIVRLLDSTLLTSILLNEHAMRIQCHDDAFFF